MSGLQDLSSSKKISDILTTWHRGGSIKLGYKHALDLARKNHDKISEKLLQTIGEENRKFLAQPGILERILPLDEDQKLRRAIKNILHSLFPKEDLLRKIALIKKVHAAKKRAQGLKNRLEESRSAEAKPAALSIVFAPTTAPSINTHPLGGSPGSSSFLAWTYPAEITRPESPTIPDEALFTPDCKL